MDFPQTLLQINGKLLFAYVASEKKTTTKNGVATKFMASFYLSNIRKKTFLPKMELLQNLWQTFACVTSEKQTF